MTPAPPETADALATLGNTCAEAGRLDEAVACYQRALAIKPDYAEVFVVLGNALAKQGKDAGAELSYRKAITLKPALAEAHNNLGTLLYNKDRVDEAVACYTEALRLAPAHADAAPNLANLFLKQGDILQSQRKTDEAIAHYRRSLNINPQQAKAHNHLGNAFKDKGDPGEAVNCYERAITIDPDYTAGLFNLGSTLVEQGKAEKAAPYLQRCLALDPADSYGAQLLLARMGIADTPQRASDAHMQRIYAQRAAFWDHGIQSASHYRGHELVAAALQRLSTGEKLDILDAGCGTGLVGLLLRKQAKTLDGIDLSPAMLEKAGEKNIYDHLYTGDLVEFMEKSPAAYDAITCAATLIHFGDLAPVFGAVKKALRKDGLFIATLFPNDADENSVSVASATGLAQGGCYAHGRHYISAMAKAHGLAVAALETDVHEYIKDVPTAALVLALRS